LLALLAYHFKTVIMVYKKVVYPVVISKTDDRDYPYFVSIPVINGMTQGATIDEALDMAREYIGETAIDMLDDDEMLPDSVYELPKTTNGDIVTLVDVDVEKYIKSNDTRVIKKTLTIPSYLNQLGNDAGINFSQLLTETLEKKLVH
jgi:predicted RNase H-like HicB family nuclease